MIVTVTLNPSLDRAIEIDHLARGDVLRARSARLDPGGKGVNVSRALLANGVASRAVLPCGGDEGAQLVRLLAAEGVDLVAVPIGGQTRSNITLAEPDGTVTKVNEPGPTLSAVEFDAVTGQALAAAGTAGWVVVCGSLPPGVTPAAFGRLCDRIVAAGVRLAVDTSGPALRAAAEAGAHLVKPNREELSDVVGRPLGSRSDVIAAADQVRAWGAGAVLASLGADGAILVTADTVVSGTAAVTAPRSTVGAGDALLAGFLAALTRSEAAAAGATGPTETANRVSGPATTADTFTAVDEARAGGGRDGRLRPDLVAALAEGLAWGAAAVSLPGSRMPRPDEMRRGDVVIHPDSDPVRSLASQG
ncbi:1-phosphofructokinase family hexose kinase [Asanoa siamensis]|uniref:1-phosphofructokinase n=1 Tax=Asanoa siamensis TaxID=926357 RepID=A0ABQ4CNU2_9ACTN|nr:1-phosphofructokinase family hexose kinase [Asanoa siamensis]GIF72668.1 1-phosphofructokinase [Asanoa siamensis]